ncbi:MAG: hypothetical protein FWG65_12640 [Turicibacter sp.]|nr:hypothetical protein [Turicibacter sp.]
MQSDGNMGFSDMQFRDFGTDNCYRIEESNLYIETLEKAFKIVEFVVYQPIDADTGKLIFVEAKTNLPPQTKSAFNKEIADISQKFMDALQVICGIWHGGLKNTVQLPANFDKFRENGKDIVFLLVAKSLDNESLLDVEEAIYKKLMKERKLWNFDVRVLNEEFAKRENFVLM